MKGRLADGTSSLKDLCRYAMGHLRIHHPGVNPVSKEFSTMKRNKLFVVGVLAAAAAFLLVSTGLRAQDNDRSDGPRACSQDHREECFLGSFSETVQANGQTFRALLTVSPGGGAVETNTAQGLPVTVHGSWEATKEEGKFALTFITFDVRGGPITGFTRETINLDKSGNNFTEEFNVEELDTNGNVIFTIVGTATGKRIAVVPL